MHFLKHLVETKNVDLLNIKRPKRENTMEQNQKKELRSVFISWQPYCSRSDNIAREFNGKSFKIYYGSLGSRYSTILVKYFMQFLKSLIILFRESPDVVFVMSPPVFCCLPVYVYCKLKNKKFILDIHTGALVDKLWKKVMFLQKFFVKSALFSMITNEEVGDKLRKWNCKYRIVPDVPIKVRTVKKPVLKGKYNITLVNTFAKDEPLDNFLEAAKKIDSANFFITGKINSNNSHFAENINDHIKFTDFLPDPEYYGLLMDSDIVIVLTTRDKTMQRGAYEAIYLGRPVITSDWKVLRNNFSIGAVFVDNSVEGIEKGINNALKNLGKLELESRQLRAIKLNIWEGNYKYIKQMIDLEGKKKR